MPGKKKAAGGPPSSLGDYRAKRDFQSTPEPSGAAARRSSAPAAAGRAGPSANAPPGGFPRFVVQEHHASRLHWDLRLEMDGVLKSWAVPKGPPLERGLKRLAMQVEDHPLDYISFEGTIPAGNYGAGTVAIWDKGHYALIEKSPDKVSFAALGEKMRGAYHLVHTRENQWLLMKTTDDVPAEETK